MNKFFWQLLVLLVSLLGASDVLAGTGAFYSTVDPNTQCGWTKTTRNENGELKTEYHLDPGKSDDPKCGMYSGKKADFAKLPQYGSLDEAQSVAKNLALQKYESVAGNTMQEKQKNAEMAGKTCELVKDDGSHIWVNVSLESLDGAGGTTPDLHFHLPNGWKVEGCDTWHAGNHTDSKYFDTRKITMTTLSNTDAKGLLNGASRSETVFDFAAGTTVRMYRDGTVHKLTDEGWVRIDDTMDYRLFCGLEGQNKTAEMFLSPEQNRDEGAYCPPSNPSSLTLRSKTTQQEIGTMTLDVNGLSQDSSGWFDPDTIHSLADLLETGEEIVEVREDLRADRRERKAKEQAERERKAAEEELRRQQQPAEERKKAQSEQKKTDKKAEKKSSKTKPSKTEPTPQPAPAPAATVADTTLPTISLPIATSHVCTDFEFVRDQKAGDVMWHKVYRCTECGREKSVNVKNGEAIDDVIADNKERQQLENQARQAAAQAIQAIEKSGATIKWSDYLTDD